MKTLPFIISFLVFLAVSALTAGVLLPLFGVRIEIRQRLQRFAGKSSPAKEEDSLSLPARLRMWEQKISQVFASRSFAQVFGEELAKTDLPLKGEEFMLLLFGTSVLLPLIAWLISRSAAPALLLAAAGALLPLLWLKTAKKRKAERFNRQLGDALSVLTNSLRAGYSFLQAVEKVSQETSPPLAEEFALLLREIQLGINTEEALLRLGKRVSSDDLDLLITAVLIQRQAGGNLAEIIDNISQTIRERIRIQGEIKTLTAQGRVSGIIIGLLPLAVIGILTFINPGYVSMLFKHPWGQIMLLYAAASEVIGAIIIRRIISIEV